MPCHIGEIGEVHAEQLHRGGQTLFRRHGEDDLRLGGDGQPGVLRQFPFELAGRPSGITERDEHVMGLALLAHVLQDVARTG